MVRRVCEQGVLLMSPEMWLMVAYIGVPIALIALVVLLMFIYPDRRNRSDDDGSSTDLFDDWE